MSGIDHNASAAESGDTAAPPAADLEIDATGLACPLPILRAKKALATLTSGQVLKVITTDRNAIRDFQAFARQTGNALVSQQENGGQGVHYLRRR
jgi:tRNA 2-thiouridine synthesizing protein A